jgi:hypothetical protein
MAIDPIDYEKFKRMSVPYGLYFGLLQMPVAWIFAHWFSMPIACALSLVQKCKKYFTDRPLSCL